MWELILFQTSLGHLDVNYIIIIISPQKQQTGNIAPEVCKVRNNMY